MNKIIYYCEQNDPFCAAPNCLCNTVRPKKGTLQEAAEKYANESPEPYYGINPDKEKWFIKGAKWQSERSYSEEEVLKLLRESHFVQQNIDEWFNQNKK